MAAKAISGLVAVGTALTTTAMVEISMGGASSSATIANITTVQQATPLPIAAGGTGAANVGAAVTALGVLPLTGGNLTGTLNSTGNLNAQTGTAIPAGGTQDVGQLFSSTAHFGFIFGSGAPAASMHQGALYLRSDGAPSVNLNGATGWAPVAAMGSSPVTTTGAAYTMGATDTDIIINASATSTVTLLGASTNTGRALIIKTIAAQSVNSASSNVAPIGSTVAGTAILGATTGKFALLRSDGTNWITMMSN